MSDEEKNNDEETNKEETDDEASEEAEEEEDEENEEDEEEDDDEPESETEEATDVEVPEQFEDLISDIENMSVLELNDLVKVLEKKFGVSAAAMAAAGGGGGEQEEEKDEYTVELTGFGDSKIGVIKVVKSVLGLGLKEAKDLVEDAPVELKKGVPTEDAEEWKEKIEEAGGEVELK